MNPGYYYPAVVWFREFIYVSLGGFFHALFPTIPPQGGNT